MDNIRIIGRNKLRGEVEISTAKNAILPIIAATILTDKNVSLIDIPFLNDVLVISEMLKSMGCQTSIEGKNLNVCCASIDINEPDDILARRMRASSLLMGPLLAKLGSFRISLPGGCSIGSRPIDLHMKGFSSLGADINIGHGYVEAKAKKLIGNSVYLDFPSVGATENIMMAAVLAEGITTIQNAAEEPEIEDLANFLISMGAKIEGAGTDCITIEGVKELGESKYRAIYDRIEAGTFMIAAAITNSKIKLNNINDKYIRPIIAKLVEAGVVFEMVNDGIIIDAREKLEPFDIKTMPYPGFPTDMQPQIMALLSTIKGTSIVTETIFENRFMHVPELKRLGSNIKVEGRTAAIQGVEKLTGAKVKATDLRAGAALILAGLVAEDETIVSDVYHIDRGYVDIEKKFRQLGAKIDRV